MVQSNLGPLKVSTKLPRFERTFHKAGFLTGMLLLVLVGTLAISSLLSLVANGRAVTRTLQVNHGLDKVLLLLTDAEMNEHSYIITGEASYWRRYQKTIGSGGLEGQLQRLRILTAEDERQKTQLERLKPLIEIRVRELEAAMEARRLNGLDAARAVVVGNFPRKTADKIRGLIAEINEAEDQRLSLQTEQRDRGAQRSVLYVVGGAVLAMGILSLSGALLQQEIAERKRSEETVRRLNSELEVRVQRRTEHLEIAQQQISTYTRELEMINIEMLERLARAGEFRDDDTGQHTQRVGLTAGLIAQQLGLPLVESLHIQQAARLHDLGKIGISDLILLKPGSLTEEEFATMKTHTVIGAALFSDGHSDVIRIAQLIAESHHERWDGQGYPHGLSGEDIPLSGRIVAVADVFDALTHERPYKKAWPVEKAVAEIQAGSGKQFDPQVVEAFLALPHAELL